MKARPCAPGTWVDFVRPKGEPPWEELWPTLVALDARQDELAAGAETLLYVIREHGGYVKIGTAKEPVARLKNLQVANPRPLVLLGAVPATTELEKFIHASFQPERVSGEWFRVSKRLQHFLAMLEGASQTLSDMLANGEPFVSADDTIAFLIGPVEWARWQLERAA